MWTLYTPRFSYLLSFLASVSMLLLVGWGLVGCGSSSTASGSGTISAPSSNESTPRDETGAEPVIEERVYAQGRVITPDTVAVPNAFIRTDPPVTTTQSDSLGRFWFYQPFPEDEYTFTAFGPERGLEGRTVVRAPRNDLSQKKIYIVLGKEGQLNAIDIDSIRANPSGPGMKRTGN